MAQSKTVAAVIGGTGLVGSYILETLLSLPTISTVHTVSRRAPKPTGATLTPHLEADSAKWPSTLTAITPAPPIFFSALGTTKAAAGGVAQQRFIDYDLNLSMATAAKQAGTKVYVLISSGGSDANSSFPYMKMKGELEEAVKKLDFESTIILKPGLIVGTREESRPAEAVMRGITGFLGKVSGGMLTDMWAQDADVIARASVVAGLEALKEGKGGVKVLGQADIVKLGKKEWESRKSNL